MREKERVGKRGGRDGKKKKCRYSYVIIISTDAHTTIIIIDTAFIGTAVKIICNDLQWYSRVESVITKTSTYILPLNYYYSNS